MYNLYKETPPNLSDIRKLELPPQGLNTLFGVQDQNIKYLETLLDVSIGARGNELMLDGDPRDIETVEQILRDFGDMFDEGQHFTDKELKDAFKQIAEDRAYSLKDYFLKARFNPAGKKQVAPKTANQRKYLDAIANNDLVFGIGVAGTGKSYLAVAMAVDALFKKQVSRIILTRPAVEAGERLGFLPGDLQEKVDPYLRPLYDALFDLVDSEKVTKMLEKRIIEIAPLAFMRGRTLADAFIILDEAQNTTSEQMKMFLTRIGFGSKVVVTGDRTQIDLPRGQKSGLKEAEEILKDVDLIEFVYFSDKDCRPPQTRPIDRSSLRKTLRRRRPPGRNATIRERGDRALDELNRVGLCRPICGKSSHFRHDANNSRRSRPSSAQPTSRKTRPASSRSSASSPETASSLY